MSACTGVYDPALTRFIAFLHSEFRVSIRAAHALNFVSWKEYIHVWIPSVRCACERARALFVPPVV